MRFSGRLAGTSFAIAAALLLGACTSPVRLATPAETRQATQGGGQAATGATPQPGSAASPAPNATPATGNPPAGSGALNQFQDTLRNLAAQASPSVVEIQTGSGLGSGVIFDSR